MVLLLIETKWPLSTYVIGKWNIHSFTMYAKKLMNWVSTSEEEELRKVTFKKCSVLDSFVCFV